MQQRTCRRRPMPWRWPPCRRWAPPVCARCWRRTRPHGPGRGPTKALTRRSVTLAAPGNGRRRSGSGCSWPDSRCTRSAWRTTRRHRHCSSASATRLRSPTRRRWRWWAPARRRATASVWRHSSAPTWRRRVSAWCPVWPWASTAPPTRAPAAPARLRSPWWRAGSTMSIHAGTSACGGEWRRRASSCPSLRPGCPRRSGAFRSATACWPP